MMPSVGDKPLRQDEVWGKGGAIFVGWQSSSERAESRTAVTHHYAAVAYQTGGRSQVEQNGRWTLREGDVFLVPAGQPHRHLGSKDAAFWGVGFCVSCFASEDAGDLLEPFERVRAGASAVIPIPKDRRPFVERLILELKAQTESGAGSRSVQRSLLTLILHEVRSAARWEDAPPGPSGVVADALRFIERNCLRKLTLAEVARAVGRSPAYVTTAISQATGRSVVEWITSGRLAEARRLLLHSDERVDIVAERVGYADATHFIRMFRRAHGITPAAWRASRAEAARSLATAAADEPPVSRAGPARRARR